ncbi:ATP synthase subunit delta [Desulfovibrionales bacterium]
MIRNIAARRYASALFAIGKRYGLAELKIYGKDLAGLVVIFADTPELVQIFKNFIIGTAEKKKLIVALLSKIDACQMVYIFCSLLADKGRLAILPEIDTAFQALLDIENGMVRGVLTTAIALAYPKQAELKVKLEVQSGRKIDLIFKVDPAILGGLTLQVSDKVIDTSLRAQLSILKDNITRGE